MKRYVILALVFLVLVKIMTIHIIDLKVKQVCPLVPTSVEISNNEVDTFLIQWVEYVNKGYMKKVPENFELDGTKMSDRLPWMVKLWFDKNCINPERFYYTEQRLRSILKAYELKKHTQSVIAILSEQQKAQTDPAQKQWYQDLIEEQDQISKVEGVSEEEMNIVEGRENLIQEILR